MLLIWILLAHDQVKVVVILWLYGLVSIVVQTTPIIEFEFMDLKLFILVTLPLLIALIFIMDIQYIKVKMNRLHIILESK